MPLALHLHGRIIACNIANDKRCIYSLRPKFEPVAAYSTDFVSSSYLSRGCVEIIHLSDTCSRPVSVSVSQSVIADSSEEGWELDESSSDRGQGPGRKRMKV